MVSIATAVFKKTIGLLVNKGRDLAAKRLKDGDVTEQQFRSGRGNLQNAERRTQNAERRTPNALFACG